MSLCVEIGAKQLQLLPFMARLGPPAMSALAPLLGDKRTLGHRETETMTDRTSRARAKVATKPAVLGHYVHNIQSLAGGPALQAERALTIT